MKTVIFQVDGMSCGHCEKRVRESLLSLNGVENCAADAKLGEVHVNFDEISINMESLKNEIIKTGYQVL